MNATNLRDYAFALETQNRFRWRCLIEWLREQANAMDAKPAETKRPQLAVERAMELMMVPKSQLPPLAAEFAQHLCSKVGMCGETFVTAFAVYAQCVECLPCDDPLYMARGEDVEWFRQRRREVVRETELAWAREREKKRAIKST